MEILTQFSLMGVHLHFLLFTTTSCLLGPQGFFELFPSIRNSLVVD